MDRIRLAEDGNHCETLVNMVMNCWVPYNNGKFLSSLVTVDFSRMTHLHGVSNLIIL
jgi:hypothetical protein